MTPDWLTIALAAMTGAALGSFLNVCIYRWPAEQSVLSPPSRCPVCEHRLAWYDNVPIFGWLFLRGRCRYCATPVSAQYPIIELTVALIWAAAVVRFGVTLDALHSGTLLTLLLGIAMTDAREMVIPDQFTLVGAGIGLAIAAVPDGFSFTRSLVGAIGGYAVLWGVKLAAEKALGKPALGIGDIHMMAMVGAFLGPAGALLTLMLGSVFGLVIGVPFTAWRGRYRTLETYLPLGVFLAIGAAVTHVWGDAIIDAYLRFIGV